MNPFRHSEPLQKFLHFGFQATGCAATVVVMGFLILAWILTSPFLRIGVYLSDLYRLHFASTHQTNSEKTMKIKTTSLLLVACLGLSAGALVMGITGCAGDRYHRSTGEQIDDESLRLRVDRALHNNPDYKFDGVNVTVFKGMAQLSGFVDTSDQKSAAADIARKVEGIRDVQNNITVKEQNETNNGQFVDDKSLTGRVRGALSQNPDYKFAEVNVDVFRGTVQLSGFVDSLDQKSKAAEIAKQVPGVKDVVNNITVKP